mmetsp:Transcript_26802/g.77457  ORF Transcript_26802/g.77457 Transcript_26802/m.77457 type:complete len:205 (-) Transcript_26802:783-1397(-)
MCCKNMSEWAAASDLGPPPHASANQGERETSASKAFDSTRLGAGRGDYSQRREVQGGAGRDSRGQVASARARSAGAFPPRPELLPTVHGHAAVALVVLCHVAVLEAPVPQLVPAPDEDVPEHLRQDGPRRAAVTQEGRHGVVVEDVADAQGHGRGREAPRALLPQLHGVHLQLARLPPTSVQGLHQLLCDPAAVAALVVEVAAS